MKTSSKIKTFLIIFFIAIFAIITARHFIGLHFKKKFSVRPAPGIIVSTVEKSLFYKSIETFGTAIAQNSKAYRVQASNINGKLNLENRFVKKGEKILTLKDGGSLIADFAGKVGKREIAQGVLGSESLIITLDDLKKIVIDIKAGSPADIAIFPQPGLAANMAAIGGLTPLSSDVKQAVLDNYAAGQSWVDLTTYADANGKDQFYGIFFRVNVIFKCFMPIYMV